MDGEVVEERVDENVAHRRDRHVDVFDIINRVPIFTRGEDVEDSFSK